MPPGTIQKLAFDGPFSITQLIVVGVVLALITAFLAWREGRAANSFKLFGVLFLLRLVAIIVVLWMLAGASKLTVARELKQKSIVFLVDSSPSMGLVDPVDDSGSSLRWSIAEKKTATGSIVGALDKVIGTLRSAQSEVGENRQAIKATNPAKNAANSADRIRQAIDSAVSELRRLSSETARVDAEASVELSRVATFLKDSQTPPSGSRGAMSRTNRQVQEDRLDEIDAFLEAGSQRVERLSQKLAGVYERTPGRPERASVDADSKLARRDKVAAWLDTAESSWLKDLESKAQVSRYEFATKVLPVAGHDWRQTLLASTNQSDNGTDLSAALNRAVEDSGKRTVDAVVLVTDGGHNAVRDPREAASALRGIPLHIVPIGTAQMPRDVILHHTHCPRAVFKNDTVVVDAMVTAFGCPGEQLHIELLSDGALAESQTMMISSGVFDGRLSFRWKAAQLGRHKLRVKIAPLPKEHSVENNEAEVEVDVMEDTIRVLVADDLPRWEFRYMANLFKRDKHVDFEQLLFEPNEDPQTATSSLSFPRDLESWRRYRVVILGDISPAHLPPAQQEMLRKYVVEEGGNLIIIAGETAMPAAYAGQPLAAMLPATASTVPVNPAQGLGLVVTAEGSVSIATQLDDDPLASDRVWREMSTKLPIYNLSSFAKPKPTSHVLIAASSPKPGVEAQAFLSWQYIGLGRVIYVAAPVTYQLRYRNGDGYHHRFWGQLLRWAVAREMSGGSKTVHLITDKNRYEQGDQAQIVLRLSQLDGRAVPKAQASVEARKGGQLIKVVELHEEPDLPGAYHGNFDDLPLGPISLRAVGPTVESLLKEEGRTEPVEQTLNIDPRGSSEMNNPLCNLPLLTQLADASGGSVIPPTAVENALSRLDLTPEMLETVLSREPIWNRWELLAVFIGCLTIEWITRKFWRMV